MSIDEELELATDEDTHKKKRKGLKIFILISVIACTLGIIIKTQLPNVANAIIDCVEDVIYVLTGCYFDLNNNTVYGKPVIYLYPAEETDINIRLELKDVNLTHTYPRYNNETGWIVKAEPDGTLKDNMNREYPYLFWEGVGKIKDEFTEGFCIKGEDTLEFLEEKLTILGLSHKEQADFITFWLPKMENNQYNIIKFNIDEYREQAELITDYEFDTEITVYMTWKASDKPVELKEQELKQVNRAGSTIVEWGGTELDK